MAKWSKRYATRGQLLGQGNTKKVVQLRQRKYRHERFEGIVRKLLYYFIEEINRKSDGVESVTREP